jgi:hypothetical protein
MTDAGPVVLGDLADSGGAGSPGDGTSILAELLKQKAQRAVVGNIADPAAVKLAIQAGVGKQLTLTVGARIDQFRGDPVEISGRVRTIQDARRFDSDLGLKVIRSPVRSPQANALCERVIGALRRECLDWMISSNEDHLRRILWSWLSHYNRGRPHSSLGLACRIRRWICSSTCNAKDLASTGPVRLANQFTLGHIPQPAP